MSSAAPATMITPENCPRDEAGLRLLSRVVRYRLALNMGLFPNESAQEAAFAGADDNTQIHTLLTALQARDQTMSNGHPPAPGQQYAQPPQQPPLTPQPLAPAHGGYAAPPMAPPPGQYAPAPGQYAPPPPAAPPPPQYSMPPQYQQPPPQTPPMPPAPQAAPPPPQYQQPPAPPAYTPPPQAAPQMAPQPQYAPPPPAYAPPPMAMPAPQQPQYQQPPPPAQAPMMRQPSTVGDPGNAGAQHGMTADRTKILELESTVLGMARTQNMMFNLVLEMAQNQLGLDKQTLAMKLIQHAQAGEPMRFFDSGAAQGKVG